MKKLYLIQINYKSGISMKAWFIDLNYENGTWEWELPDPKVGNPIKFGVDNIESVWILETKDVP